MGSVTARIRAQPSSARLPARDGPEARDAWLQHATDYIDEQVASGDYSHLSDLLSDEGTAAFWRRLEASGFEQNRFERGLKRLLDGIELDLKSRGG